MGSCPLVKPRTQEDASRSVRGTSPGNLQDIALDLPNSFHLHFLSDAPLPIFAIISLNLRIYND